MTGNYRLRGENKLQGDRRGQAGRDSCQRHFGTLELKSEMIWGKAAHTSPLRIFFAMASRGEMGRVSSGSAALFKILSHSAQMSALVFFTVQKKEGGGGGGQGIPFKVWYAGMQRGVFKK